MFVFKGALSRVLGINVTVSATASSATTAKLVVEASNIPTADELSNVVAAANAKLLENVPVTFEDMDKTEAEAKYKDVRINGCPLFDKNPPPRNFTRLGVLIIKDWCLALGSAPLVASTNEIGRIAVTETTLVEKKGQKFLQFTLEVTESESTSADGAVSSATGAQEHLPPMSTDVCKFAQQLVDIALPAAANDAARDAARATTLKQFENELYLFKNAAYAAGLLSTRSKR